MQLEVLEKDRGELIPLVLTRAAERRMRAIGRVWLGAHLHALHIDALRRTHSDALKRTQTQVPEAGISRSQSDAIRHMYLRLASRGRSPRARPRHDHLRPSSPKRPAHGSPTLRAAPDEGGNQSHSRTICGHRTDKSNGCHHRCTHCDATLTFCSSHGCSVQ